MIMPIALHIRDLELHHVYLVAATEYEVSVSFQARVLEIEPPDSIDSQWVIHFSGGLTLRLSENSASTFFEVLEEETL